MGSIPQCRDYSPASGGGIAAGNRAGIAESFTTRSRDNATAMANSVVNRIGARGTDFELSAVEAVMTSRFTRILVPIDFEPASEAALAYASDLARATGASLFLLHAVDDPAATGVWTPEVYVPASSATRDVMVRSARTRLEALLTTAHSPLAPTVEARVGAAIPVIEEYAREQAISLIVMGTHGRRGLAHMLLGSVAERLVRTAPCPVLTVREYQPLTFTADRPVAARGEIRAACGPVL